jgi:hypothetical protein
MWKVVEASGEDGPAAFVPVRGFRPFALRVASAGGVGLIALPSCNGEFNSLRGRLLAAAVSRGGG